MRLTRASVVLVVFLCFAASEWARGGGAPAMELAVCEGSLSDLPRGAPRRNWAFDRAKELGVTHIRGFLPWVHTESAVYDDSYKFFPMWDSTVDEARERGFEVQLCLFGLASKQYGGDDRTGIDPDPKEYGLFVTACAKHFKGRVHRYSVWNEPNLPVYLMPAPATSGAGGNFTDAVTKATGGKPLSPEQNYRQNILPKNAQRYRELYAVGYRAIKGVDPSAEVLVGELSSSHDPVEFMNEMAPPGTHLVADGFALHPYQFAVAPDSPPNPKGTGAGISKLQQVQTLLDKMAKAGRMMTPNGGKLPLYLTEFGYQKLEGRTFKSPATQLPEATRQAWLPKAFEAARESGARQMLYFMLLPTPPDYSWDTSILDANGDPLPSFTALKDWATKHGYATGGQPAAAPAPAAPTPPATSVDDGLDLPPGHLRQRRR